MNELREKAESLGIKVDGRWKHAKLREVIDEVERQMVDSGVLEEIQQPTPNEINRDRIEAMNAYALRIWNGQSPDLPMHDRVGRVKDGLTAQGWGDILEHLSLPNA